MPFNLRKQLAAPLGLLIVCALAIIYATHFYTDRIDAGARAIIQAAEPRHHAILQMEVHSLRLACAALRYCRNRDSASLEEMRQSGVEFHRWVGLNARHASTAGDQSLAEEVERDFDRLEHVANVLVQAEDARVEKGAVLRTAWGELDGLLVNCPTRPGDAAQLALAGEIRVAANSVGSSIGLLLAGTPPQTGDSVQVRAENLQAMLAMYRKRGALPRERTWATDLEERLKAIVALSEELRINLEQHTSSWTELLRLRRQLGDKVVGGLQSVSDNERASVAKALASALTHTRWTLMALAGVSLLCGIGIVIFATHSISRPISHLVEVARVISNGRTRHRASPEAAGDFRVLADAFNQMIEARQQAEEKLQLAHDSLELKVQARTVELWRANKALREETEQRAHAEREFQQAQKMDALGKLAGSIAHDFNNLLTVIIGGAECAQSQLGANHPAVSLLQTVQQAGERAAGLTRPLLTFSRNQVLALEPLNLNDAAEEASRMLHRLMGVNIELRLQLEPELRPVLANANQLQQVLINLAVNARDAMDGTGVLTIATRNVTVDPTVARRNGLTASEYWVELAVSDTGCGMDAATKARIFEPFFTTKPAGRGTGLGLSTVFGIVKQTGGLLNVESKVGEGTTFQVILPATTVVANNVVPSPDSTARKEVVSGDETLLLVDDEEDIRELATITLEGRGYRILSAANSEEAIVLGEKHAGEIRALITDVVMPGINGVQLAGVLTKIIPNLRVLFVSGHSNESISAETLQATRADYLQKPYLGETLATKVRELLAKSGSRAAEPRKERYSAWVN